MFDIQLYNSVFCPYSKIAYIRGPFRKERFY
jgi:hypothetical protein